MDSAFILASAEVDQASSLVSIAWIMGAALLAPIVSQLTRGFLPSVALLLLFGVIIGPSALGLAEVDGGIGMLKELGVGALFLLAGFEIDRSSLRSRQVGSSLLTWVLCLVLATAGAWLLLRDVALSLVIGIALTSTALGTVMPMLKQDGMTETPVGRSVMIHGAIGEVAPITAMALLLSVRSTLATALILLAFLVVAAIVAAMPRAIGNRFPWVRRAFLAASGATDQTILRLIILVLAILMAVTAVFELDIVLGAFAAGFILNAAAPDDIHDDLEPALDAVFYSLLIPVFFVTSGMDIDWDVIRDNALPVIGVPLLILLARGLPVFLRENSHRTGDDKLSLRERLQVALYAATGLPIIVAVTSLAVSSEILDQETSSIFVAGGALTVAIFPLLATLVSFPSKKS
ncbi:cation:proton antiporter [Corynebacterium liangguodongii]|uniref:Sodium:proton antiporter n=1 Tax=Corynebacterium liangguodongii TaxID=2079535 RepID=A0A2S0WEJ5_9CORY|nr:cation:proton antiporter [Corynebacterium liangguodongii]AWB84189.1 sodium:proton antiporter [Corynebacterium liangguodongii]PWC00199.1 sodium:proton antiporter [Corynebacterium liangguodongii]